MRLSDYLCPSCVLTDLAAKGKNQALAEMAAAAASTGLSKETMLAVLLEREKYGSTAVGEGVAIPHGKMRDLGATTMVFARSLAGIDFAAPDGKLCHLFFMVLMPEGAAGLHLGLLGVIARLAKDGSFSRRLLQAKNAQELTEFLSGV